MSNVDHTKNIIEVKDLSFSYHQQVVLERIGLNIHQGDYLGIIGPNGGGKTTLLKIMVGLLQPNEGSVLLFGTPISDFHDWSRIGYVPQKILNFDPQFPVTISEVVSMGLFGKKGLFHWLNTKDMKEVQNTLERVGLWNYRNHRIGDLSGGQQQRAFIARALVGKPDILFLDEPTAGVDIKAQEEFYRLLKKINQELNITLVLVSHEIDIVARETTEVACINRSLRYHGTPKEFIEGNMLSTLYGRNIKMVMHDHSYGTVSV
jgi:zinc transport system ATP-binding protein